MDKYEDNNEITYDIDLEDLDAISVTIDVDVEWDEPDQQSKFDRLKGATSFIGSKIKAIKDADIFTSIKELQEDNPGYSLLLYKGVRKSEIIKQIGSTSYYYPVNGFFFYSIDKTLKYSAIIAELRKQNIQIKLNDIIVSEIRENSLLKKHSTFSIFIKGIECGELVRNCRKKGVEYFSFNSWEIRQKWTGNLEICDSNNKLVATWDKWGLRKIAKCWHEEDELLIVTILIATNAYHNSKLRRLNHGRPYEVYRDSES